MNQGLSNFKGLLLIRCLYLKPREYKKKNLSVTDQLINRLKDLENTEIEEML